MDTLKYSFFPRTITDWNQLDANIVLAHQSVPSKTGSENNRICLRPIQHLCLHNAVPEHLCQSWITIWDMQHTDKDCRYVTNTHLFNGPLSGTSRVSQYEKGKTNLDFTEARGSEWQWHHLGRMQVCTSFETDNHASTPPVSFLKAGCASCHPTNSVKTPKGQMNLAIHNYYNHEYTEQTNILIHH